MFLTIIKLLVVVFSHYLLPHLATQYVHVISKRCCSKTYTTKLLQQGISLCLTQAMFLFTFTEFLTGNRYNNTDQLDCPRCSHMDMQYVAHIEHHYILTFRAFTSSRERTVCTTLPSTLTSPPQRGSQSNIQVGVNCRMYSGTPTS